MSSNFNINECDNINIFINYTSYEKCISEFITCIKHDEQLNNYIKQLLNYIINLNEYFVLKNNYIYLRKIPKFKSILNYLIIYNNIKLYKENFKCENYIYPIIFLIINNDINLVHFIKSFKYCYIINKDSNNLNLYVDNNCFQFNNLKLPICYTNVNIISLKNNLCFKFNYVMENNITNIDRTYILNFKKHITVQDVIKDNTLIVIMTSVTINQLMLNLKNKNNYTFTNLINVYLNKSLIEFDYMLNQIITQHGDMLITCEYYKHDKPIKYDNIYKLINNVTCKHLNIENGEITSILYE